MKILDFVGKLYVISLDFREERRERLTQNLVNVGLAKPEDITWVKAVDGHLCQPPDWFRAGPGAWGCLQSHLRVVQDAAIDRVESFCVLEDDAVFSSDSPKLLKRLMREVPRDWGQIYLGGDHLLEPEPMQDRHFVWRCRNVNRTHAFLLHQRAYRTYQAHIMHAPQYADNGSWHVDHQLGAAHERQIWPTYAPRWWLAGQEAGSSNISGMLNPQYWWHHRSHIQQLPYVYVEPGTSSDVLAAFRSRVHFGRQLVGETLQDVGLTACIGNPEKLREWMELIAAEALSYGRIPGIQHPELSLEHLRQCWKAPVLPASICDLDDVCDYPYNGYFPHVLNRRYPGVLSGSAA